MSRGGKAAYGHERKPKTEIDGIKFMSPGEAERYLELCILKLQGKVKDITLQPSFELQPAFRKCCGVLWIDDKLSHKIYSKGECPICNCKMPVIRDMRYIADFKVKYSDDETTIEDVKGRGGYVTPQFMIKKKIFEFRYPTLTLIVIKRAGKPKRIAELLAEREALKSGEKR